MTTLKLDTLSPRIQAHKMALVHIVKPPVCTERALHYTEAYQQHLDKPIPVRRALALAHHLAERTIWIKHDELIVGNQASEVRAAPIFPEYTVSWIEKEIDDLADRPGAGFAVSEENKRVLHEVCPWWRGQNRTGSLLRHVYRRAKSAAGDRHYQSRRQYDLRRRSPCG
ncbi:pyruvate formate-lyase [Klebsiella michiganensis]|uniref:Pyruvate formate-lyase n=1 Tax=Klebsiella michiganensis TaxID=1134687 RepID=A0A7H4N383_9ENTR|nr:pyruvate formate-lyase [Klebsiella michiganensis]